VASPNLPQGPTCKSRRLDAQPRQGVIESLKNKGRMAVLAPGPNEDTVRVLVGPLEKTDVGKVRLELEGAASSHLSRTTDSTQTQPVYAEQREI